MDIYEDYSDQIDFSDHDGEKWEDSFWDEEEWEDTSSMYEEKFWWIYV
tara:strand:+ start:6588 stop:6731 length:144 start_codon:yes stop_codon:yes gene_type:complete